MTPFSPSARSGTSIRFPRCPGQPVQSARTRAFRTGNLHLDPTGFDDAGVEHRRLEKRTHRPSRPGTGGTRTQWPVGCREGVQTCGPPTCKPQTVQTSVCSQTVAGFCGVAPRSRRGAGRTRRPCGSGSDLVGQSGDVDAVAAIVEAFDQVVIRARCVMRVERLQGRCSKKQPANPPRIMLRRDRLRRATSRYATLRFRGARRPRSLCALATVSPRASMTTLPETTPWNQW
mgnify:CR=1 FL=1